MDGIGAVLVPRLGITVDVSFIQQAVFESVRELGYDRPRPGQVEAVLQFVSGRDTFISLPTGSGKSLCFACTPLVFDKLREVKGTGHHSICIVVSPLNALMLDQVTKFTSKGMKAAFVGSGQEERAVYDSVLNGDMQLVYFSPESPLTVPCWREMLKSSCYKENMVCLAVDEAHLVEKWYVMYFMLM